MENEDFSANDLDEDYESFDQLQYLTLLLRSQELEDSDQSSAESEEEEEEERPEQSIVELERSEARMSGSDLQLEIENNLRLDERRPGRKRRLTGSSHNVLSLISERRLTGRYEANTKRRILSTFLPSNPVRLAQYRHKVREKPQGWFDKD